MPNPKKHLLLNAFPLQDSHWGRGVGRYTYEVYKNIITLWEKNDPEIKKHFSSLTIVGAMNPNLREFFPEAKTVQFIELTDKVEKRNLFKLFYYWFSFNPKLKQATKDRAKEVIYFLPRHQILAPQNLKTVTMVHDLAPLVTKRLGKNKLLDPLLKVEYNVYLQQLKRNLLIITNSTDTANAVKNAVSINCPAIPIMLGNVLEQGRVENAAKTESPYNFPYFFYYGGYDYNKNLPGILEALALFIKKYPEHNNVHLIFSAGDKHIETLQPLIEQNGLTDNCICERMIPDEELPRYLTRSLGLFRLSFIEGCGLPEIEAMSLGVPVLSANIGAIREMVGDYALLADPNKPETAVQNLLNAANRSIQKEILENGRIHANTFTWQATARNTIQAITQLV